MDEIEEAEVRRRAREVNLPPCWSCGYVQDGMSPAKGGGTPEDAEPEPGRSLVICLACGSLSMVDYAPSVGKYVRELTSEEYLRALSDPGVVMALEHRAIVVARARAAGWRPTRLDE